MKTFGERRSRDCWTNVDGGFVSASRIYLVFWSDRAKQICARTRVKATSKYCFAQYSTVARRHTIVQLMASWLFESHHHTAYCTCSVPVQYFTKNYSVPSGQLQYCSSDVVSTAIRKRVSTFVLSIWSDDFSCKSHEEWKLETRRIMKNFFVVLLGSNAFLGVINLFQSTSSHGFTC
jgi:hypothetical protein